MKYVQVLINKVDKVDSGEANQFQAKVISAVKDALRDDEFGSKLEKAFGVEKGRKLKDKLEETASAIMGFQTILVRPKDSVDLIERARHARIQSARVALIEGVLEELCLGIK